MVQQELVQPVQELLESVQRALVRPDSEQRALELLELELLELELLELELQALAQLGLAQQKMEQPVSVLLA